MENDSHKFLGVTVEMEFQVMNLDVIIVKELGKFSKFILSSNY